MSTFTLPLNTFTHMLRSVVQAADHTFDYGLSIGSRTMRPVSPRPLLACLNIEWHQDKDADTGVITMVATDRYRVISAEVGSTSVHGDGVVNVYERDVLDLLRVLPRLTRKNTLMTVAVTVSGDQFAVEWEDKEILGNGGLFFCTPHEQDENARPFPDWRQFTKPPEEPSLLGPIGFNPHLLASLAKIDVPRNTAWEFRFNGPGKPCVAVPHAPVTSNSEIRWTFVIMPVRLTS